MKGKKMALYNHDEEIYKSYRRYLAQKLRAERYEDKIIKKQQEEIAEDQRQAQEELEN